MIFALAGNQNCGKTTLFNQLTGSNQHVGNFPGVTVERKVGAILRREHGRQRPGDRPGAARGNGRHLRRRCGGTLRARNPQPRHRDQQTQLHALPAPGRREPRRSLRRPREHEQSLAALHPFAHPGKPLESAHRPLVLRHQPHQDTVAADHRPRMGVPLLRRCHVRRPGALPAGHRRRPAPHQRLPHSGRIRRMP